MQGRQRKNLNPERVNKVLKKAPRRVRPRPPTASRTPHHRYTIQHGRTRDNTNKHHEEPHKREGHAEAVFSQEPPCAEAVLLSWIPGRNLRISPGYTKVH